MALQQVENIGNNNLLTYLSEDHEDLEALRLNHFFIGRNFYNDCLVNDIRDKDICSRKKLAPSSDIIRSFLKMLVA